jgi:hypothetical protein
LLRCRTAPLNVGFGNKGYVGKDALEQNGKKTLHGVFEEFSPRLSGCSGLIWVFNAVSLIHSGDAWLGLLYLLIMLIPTSSITLLKLKNTRRTPSDEANKWRNLLFSFQGAALAFWLFDITTTFYAINVTRLVIELNPLGWPWGILGALAFYGPTLVF